MNHEATEVPFVRRNFVLGVINGALFHGGLKLVDPAVVLTLLAYELTRSPVLAGVMAAAFTAGWNLPPILISHRVEKSPRKLPIYRLGVAIRHACYALAGAALLSSWPKAEPVHAFWVLTLLGLIASAGLGLTVPAFMDIVGRTIPAQRRGIFFGLRLTFAEAVGLVAAGVVGFVLHASRSGLRFPANFGVLFLIYILVAGSGQLCFFFVRDPETSVPSRRPGLGHMLARLQRICQRDRSYRNFLLVRIVNGLGAMYFPLLVVYGISRFGLSQSAAGAFLALQSAAVLVSSPLWGILSDRKGTLAILRLGYALNLLPVLIVLGAGLLPPISVTRFGVNAQVIALGTAFTVQALGRRAWLLGDTAYLLDLAPTTRIPTYVGLGQLAAMPFDLGPILAGFLAQSVSFEAMFATSAVAGAVALALAYLGLEEPRVGLTAAQQSPESPA